MNKEQRDLLFFGYGLGLISVIFAVGGILRHGLGPAPMVLLVCAVVFIAVTAGRWQALRPGYRGWMKVAHLIGGVVTTVILSAVFFLLFAPVGLFFRLIGRDHLERRLDRGAESYWHKRPQEDKPKESYLQQY